MCLSLNEKTQLCADCMMTHNDSLRVVSDLLETDVKVVAGGLFIIGLVVVGISMLGCIGVHLENRCFIAFVSVAS